MGIPDLKLTLDKTICPSAPRVNRGRRIPCAFSRLRPLRIASIYPFFYPFLVLADSRIRNPLNSQPLISHLANGNGCDNP
jgi:hypothetical protein